MKVTADTNVLVRAAVQDDPAQSTLAVAIMRDAETIAVPLAALCEFVWILRRGYRLAPEEISAALRRLTESGTVKTDRAAVNAGLSILDWGGDFADGVIAFEGHRLGGTVFVSFGRDACALIEAQGEAVLDLSE